MPSYAFLDRSETDYAALPRKIAVQRTLGVPFPGWSDGMIENLAREQAKQVAAELQTQGRYVAPDKEIVALIAYLQSLGKKWTPTAAQTASAR
jgi:cytochrome c oxidase cbb3-type subunit I/II